MNASSRHIALAVGVIVGCTLCLCSVPAAAETNRSVETNKQVVLSFLDNLSAGKADAALALMADSATWWIAGKPDKFPLAGTKTKTQFAELVKEVGASLPKGLRITPKGLTAEGDRVAVEAESYGETASGKIYNNLYHFLFEVRDGKIQAVREYLDTLHTKDVFVDQ
jgi:ketosteroid isomerase-like protein